MKFFASLIALFTSFLVSIKVLPPQTTAPITPTPIVSPIVSPTPTIKTTLKKVPTPTIKLSPSPIPTPKPNTSSDTTPNVTATPYVYPTSSPTPTTTPVSTPTPTPTGRYGRITSPNGGETLHQGTNYQITWVNSADVTSVRLYYILSTSPDGGNAITQEIPNTGSYSWNVLLSGITVPVQVKVELEAIHASGSFHDSSDSYFTVLPQ